MVMGADSIDSSWMTALLIVVGTGLSLWSVRRWQSQSRQRQRHSVQQLEDLQQKGALHATADSIMVDLEAFARQMSAQLDTKCTRLEALLDAADERLAALREATGTSPGPDLEQNLPASEPLIVNEPANEPVVAVEAAVEPGIDIVVSDDPISDQAHDPAANPPDASPGDEVHPDESEPAESPGADPTDDADQGEREQIYELADLGHSPLRIAQATRRAVGEVELILQLRNFS
jgi:hypothetical protein